MANADRPSGLTPIGHLDGSPYCATLKTFPVDSSNGTAIFKGDLIILEADGNVAPAGAASTDIIGVCAGVVYDRSVGATEYPGYLPASTAGNIMVEVGTDVIYEIQEDSVSANLAATDVGALFDLTAGAGSTTTGISAHELDSDASAVDVFRVLRLANKPDNAVGTNAKWHVLLNIHLFKTTTAV